MDEVLYYFAVGVVGFAVGFAVGVGIPVPVYPKDFQCTESAIVNGVAECVKYEKKEKL